MITSPQIFGGAGFTFTADGKFQYPENVVIPNTVTSLTGNNVGAFLNHSEIKKITFAAGSTVAILPSDAFNGCSGLEEITLPTSLTGNQGNSVFKNCTSLKIVNFPSGATGLGNYFFNGCSSLEEITIPSTVTSIGSTFFANCTALKTIKFESAITSLSTQSASQGNPFYNCTALEDVQVPAEWSVNTFLSNGTADYTNVLTHDSLVALIANLKDYSGGTAHTLTIGATNLARLSEAEKTVAIAKNWTLA